jgi:hypothetical protein
MKKKPKLKLVPLTPLQGQRQLEVLDRPFDECDPKTTLGTVGNPYPVAPIKPATATERGKAAIPSSDCLSLTLLPIFLQLRAGC